MKLVAPAAGQVLFEQGELGLLAALAQRRLQLELAVEVILDRALVAAGDEDEMLDTGLARLVDHVLDQRPVDHRQHFLRNGLGGGEEAGTEAGDGEYGLADRFHGACRCLGVAGGRGSRDTLRTGKPYLVPYVKHVPQKWEPVSEA